MRLADGYRWREERAYDRMAWMTAYLLSPWCAEDARITPADLLGRTDPANEVAEMDTLLGTPRDGEADYARVMAKQAARKTDG